MYNFVISCAHPGAEFMGRFVGDRRLQLLAGGGFSYRAGRKIVSYRGFGVIADLEGLSPRLPHCGAIPGRGFHPGQEDQRQPAQAPRKGQGPSGKHTDEHGQGQDLWRARQRQVDEQVGRAAQVEIPESR